LEYDGAKSVVMNESTRVQMYKVIDRFVGVVQCPADGYDAMGSSME